MKFRKLNRNTHRDLGYIFFAMTIIYGVSGISLNHIKDWNPNYVVYNKIVSTNLPLNTKIDKLDIISFLETIDEDENYKKHYYPSPNRLKIFIKNGSIVVNTRTGKAHIEKLTRRVVFYQFNFLHYNSARKFYTWFADIYGAALILLAISGLFILKGKNGITGRGAWLTALGIIIPIIFYVIYT